MAIAKKANDASRSKRPPATTPQRRENQLIAQAYDVAEKQLSDGTASSQLITHFLKLGTAKEKLEVERLRRENELLSAKVKSLASSADAEETYRKALAAMSRYQGEEPGNDDSY